MSAAQWVRGSDGDENRAVLCLPVRMEGFWWEVVASFPAVTDCVMSGVRVHVDGDQFFVSCDTPESSELAALLLYVCLGNERHAMAFVSGSPKEA